MFSDPSRLAPSQLGPKPHVFGISMAFHAAVLAWVAISPELGLEESPRTLYQQVIKPNEKKLVWYRLQDKLPEVSPLERRDVSRPTATDTKLPQQTIVASQPKAPLANQMIWQAAPRLELQQEVKSPNLLAFDLPKVTPPPERPKPKLFNPPVEKPKPQPATPVLPEAPKLEAGAVAQKPNIGPDRITAALAAKPKPKEFVPPPPKAAPPAPVPRLPEALEITFAAQLDGLPTVGDGISAALAQKPQPKTFVPPAPKAAGVGGGSLPENAPQLTASVPSGSLTTAIVGLQPADRMAVKPPEGSRPAQFAGGPNENGTGGAEPVESARIFVPDLMIRGGGKPAVPTLVARSSPTSPEALLAAARTALSIPSAPRTRLTRVASAPGGQWGDRIIYTMAIQMPNVTSFSGSWIMWFAERIAPGKDASEVALPVPLRKVDPKYIAAAADERIEGKVQLAGVIRGTGRVEAISVLKSLDDRLDRSATEALGKWEFTPAERDGTPLEIDVIVEIPFHLAPRVAR